MTEADTCRKYVLPGLYAAGWTDDQIVQERYFTDGRIVPVGRGQVRKLDRHAESGAELRKRGISSIGEVSGRGKSALLSR